MNWEEVAVLQANKQFTVGESLSPRSTSHFSRAITVTQLNLFTVKYQLVFKLSQCTNTKVSKGEKAGLSTTPYSSENKDLKDETHTHGSRGELKSKEELTSLVQRKFLREFWKPHCYAQAEHKG